MSIAKLILSFILCFAVAAAGSAVTIPSITTWYTTLTKPFFTPPNAIFGPVWTLLYLLMAISLAIVWNKPQKKQTKKALQLFFIQLTLNFLWSFVFFGMHQIFTGLIVIVLLWAAIFQTITYFFPIAKKAAYLLIPYILWVSFAAMLNLALAVLNG